MTSPKEEGTVVEPSTVVGDRVEEENICQTTSPPLMSRKLENIVTLNHLKFWTILVQQIE